MLGLEPRGVRDGVGVSGAAPLAPRDNPLASVPIRRDDELLLPAAVGDGGGKPDGNSVTNVGALVPVMDGIIMVAGGDDAAGNGCEPP